MIFTRSSSLVPRRFSGRYVSHEPLDFSRADFRNALVASKWKHVMPQARDRVCFRSIFHRFALAHPALEETALRLIQFDQGPDGQLAALRSSVAGWIFPCRHRCKQYASSFSCLVHGQRPISANRNKAPRSRAPTAVRTIANHKSLRPTFLYSERKPSQFGIQTWYRSARGSAADTTDFVKRILADLSMQGSLSTAYGVHMVSTVDAKARISVNAVS